MPAPTVRGDYDELGRIASAFGAQAESSQRALQRIKSQLDSLKGGDWIGQGAQAFYKEMDQDVLPALNRLVQALSRAQHTTLQISRIVQDAEETAARLLGASGGWAAFADGSQAAAADGKGPEAGAAGPAESDQGLAPLTVEQLRQAMPGLSQAEAEQLLPRLNSAMKEFEINTPERRRMFLAQVGHESGDLKRLTENLNYSRERLLEKFSKYFNKENVGDYVGQPKKIANHMYANRNGNGDEASGDGWRFRGRGAIQLTGRANYEAAGKALDLDLVNHPELVEQPQHAIRVSAWWWKNNGLNERVDANPTDVEGVTRVINGGTHGLDDRQARFDRIGQEPEN